MSLFAIDEIVALYRGGLITRREARGLAFCELDVEFHPDNGPEHDLYYDAEGNSAPRDEALS